MKAIYYVLIAGILVMTGACKKYEEAPLLSNPAYMRVFNNIPASVDVVHSGQIVPFLTFLMDPEMDQNGVPVKGAIVGDYLTTRELFSLSYPTNSGNSGMAGSGAGGIRPGSGSVFPVNYEYPGNEHVLTAPAINGFDLSAWAQVPSGKHRIVFVVRPQNNIPFTRLSENIRRNILVDTTLEFQQGEVYTLEVVARDLDEGKYGLYVRKEEFIHQAFEDQKIYVGFVNLSGKKPKSVEYGFGKMFPEVPTIYCSYLLPDDVNSSDQFGAHVPMRGYDNTYLTAVQRKMDTVVRYQQLPLLPRNAFFIKDSLRTYTSDARIQNNITERGMGQLPYFRFHLREANITTGGGTITCSANPRTYNNFKPGLSSATDFTPNLNLIVNTGTSYHIYGTLNIMEIVYDRIYLMQIQRGFNQVPKN